MGNLRNRAETGEPGPQGTTLFQANEIAEVISSPSADTKGDVEHAALVGTSAPFLDQRFVLKRGKTQLGRHSSNDIVLPDSSVSARHAWIIQDNGEFRLMNVLSTNGTHINENKVHEAALTDGDRIRFGRAEFVFRAPARADTGGGASAMPIWIWAGAFAIIGGALVAVLIL